MKQHTTVEQTFKLISLGCDKPKHFIEGPTFLDSGYAYTIGELIEMLPEMLAPYNNDDWEMPLSISTDSFMWTIEYDGGDFVPYEAASIELIDALYDMIVKLKEEGVI